MYNKPLRQQKVSSMLEQEQYYIDAEDVIVCPHGYFVRRKALLYETQMNEFCLGITKQGGLYVVSFDAPVFNEVRERPWQVWWYTLLSWCKILTPMQRHDGIEEYNQFAFITRFDIFSLLEYEYECDTPEEYTTSLKYAKQRMQQLYEQTPIERFMKTTMDYLDEIVTEDVSPDTRQILIEVIQEGIQKFLNQKNSVLMFDQYLSMLELQEKSFREYTKEVEKIVVPQMHAWDLEKRSELIDDLDGILSYIFEPVKLVNWVKKMRQKLSESLEMVPVKSLPVGTVTSSLLDHITPRLDELERQLASYIQNEQYEKAAHVRDEIARLKRSK